MDQEEKLKTFNKDGFVILENFLSEEECDKLRGKSRSLIDNMDLSTHPKTVFSTTDQKNDQYFLDSQDKIRFFFEENVIDEKGQLNRPKHLSINKIGHGLCLDEDYKRATFTDQIKDFSKKLDFIDPVIVQSMVIFKQPGIGGVVVPHVDGTFLMNEPSKLIGLWIALEDAEIENGCLWFLPGSHKQERTSLRMIRNPDANGPVTVFVGDRDIYDEKLFKAVPVKKGSAVVIHGNVVHKSEKNLSERSREIYTYHIAESHNSKWLQENWIQETKDYSFKKLYEN